MRPLIVVIAAALSASACREGEALPSADLAVVGESTRVRLETPWPSKTEWFDGKEVTLTAARGETLGIQVLHRVASPVSLEIRHEAIEVRGYEVTSFVVKHPSTAMYGGSKGRGTYPDALTPAAMPATNPAYFEIVVSPNATVGLIRGELAVGASRFPVSLTVVDVTLPKLDISAWAYGDPRELAWAAGAKGDPPRAKPSSAELACMKLFREHGVLFSPDVHLDWWPERRHLLSEARDVPVWIPRDPTKAGAVVRKWIEETKGTGQVPFTIPIDEPRSPEKKRKVLELARVVRDAGGGPNTFRYALTDDHRALYGELIDLYISLNAKREDQFPRWTYNGAPPHAGSMVLDAETPGTRTWGWIAWRWNIATWYIWDAIYWHDRHNRWGLPLPGRQLDPSVDPTSFNDGEDHGNFDGVLVLPKEGGCQGTLRLAAMRRGFQDKALLSHAARCAPKETERLAADVVPRALGDAPKGSPRSWSSDENAWERGRRRLLKLASSCAPADTQ